MDEVLDAGIIAKSHFLKNCHFTSYKEWFQWFTTHYIRTKTDDKCSPNSQAITTTSIERWMARGKYNINCIYVIFVRKKYLYVKFVLIFAIHVNLFGYTCYKDVRVPIRCVRAHAGRFVTGRSHVCTRSERCV